MSTEAIVPIHRQLVHIRSQYPGYLLLFRLGDFVQAFDADADSLATVTGTAPSPSKLAGIDRTASVLARELDATVAKLTDAGHRVAYLETLANQRPLC